MNRPCITYAVVLPTLLYYLRSLASALSVSWSVELHAAPKTDVVILVNGDRITGEVKDEVKELDRGS